MTDDARCTPNTAAAWRMLSFAPKDGTEIEVQMIVTARAFWCKDQERWVLARQLTRDYVDDPSLWRATGRAEQP